MDNLKPDTIVLVRWQGFPAQVCKILSENENDWTYRVRCIKKSNYPLHLRVLGNVGSTGVCEKYKAVPYSKLYSIFYE